MKRLLIVASAVLLAVGCYDDTALRGRVDDLESKLDGLKIEEIPAVESQISAIRASLGDLEEIDDMLNGYVVELQESAAESSASMETAITALTEVDENLNDRIETLKEYVEGHVAGSKTWAEETFATLQQYNYLSTEIANLKVSVDAVRTEMKTAYGEAIAKAVADCEDAMKAWVGEQLSGYYTIAETDAALTALRNLLAGKDAELDQEIESMKMSLADLSNELTAGYKEAIDMAISENDGGIRGHVASEIESVNAFMREELAGITERIEALESRMDELEMQVADLLGRIQSMSYIPLYEDGKVAVVFDKTIGKPVATLDFEVSPKAVVSDLSQVWQTSVSAKAFDVMTRSVSFITMPVVAFEADAENGVMTVTVSAENLSPEFFCSLQDVRMSVSISDGNSSVVSDYMDIYPVRWMSEKIEDIPSDNEIYYTTSDCNLLDLDRRRNEFGNWTEVEYVTQYGAALKSNYYDIYKGYYVAQFDGPVTSIGPWTFRESSIMEVALPETVTEIGEYAFSGCRGVERVVVPGRVYKIGEHAFSDNWHLKDVIIEEGVTIIGHSAFMNCESLSSLTIPGSVTQIEGQAFEYCTGLKTLALGNGVLSIGYNAFRCCGLVQLILPDSVLDVEYNAFSYCESLRSLTIGKSVNTIRDNAFRNC